MYISQRFRHRVDNGFSWLEANTRAKKTIVIMHGITGSRHDMAILAREYVALGYAVYAPDLPGHGDTPLLNIRSFDDLARWLDDFVQMINRTPTILLSNSYASAIAYEYMKRGFLPAQTHVILACPTPSVAWMSRMLQKANRALPESVAWTFYTLPVSNWLRTQVLYKGDRAVSKQWLFESERQKRRLVAPKAASILTELLNKNNPYTVPLPDNIQSRITVILGERDNVVTSQAKQQIQALLPHARYIFVANAGHILHFEAVEQMSSGIDAANR